MRIRFVTGSKCFALVAFAALAGCSSAPQGAPAVPSLSATLPADLNPSGVQLTAHYVTIPVTNSIQSDVINTFPVGMFKPKYGSFSIPSKPATCGYAKNSACNFYDGFAGNGASITIVTSIKAPAVAYTLMNAYSPQANQQLGTIEFVASGGKNVTFPLIGGKNIRDFYNGSFANTLSNGVPGTTARNVFHCVDPKTCLGGGGTGNVHTGFKGGYRVDEQQYTLAALKGQSLKKIVVSDTYAGSKPILLGLTIESR